MPGAGSGADTGPGGAGGGVPGVPGAVVPGGGVVGVGVSPPLPAGTEPVLGGGTGVVPVPPGTGAGPVVGPGAGEGAGSGDGAPVENGDPPLPN
jgi:collagen type IV alpha